MNPNATYLPDLPKIFDEALYELCAPGMFDVALNENERRLIYQHLCEHHCKWGPPQNFLEWRDAIYDSMVEMDYELVLPF